MTNARKQVLRRIIQFLLCAAVSVLGHDGARGQQNTITGNNYVLGQWDATQAARTNNSRTGTGSPVGRDTCLRPGESYFQIDAIAGQNICFCVALPGTWVNGNSVPIGATLPATCTVGQLFFDSTSGANFGLNQCPATNTWSAIGGGGITYQGSVTAGAPVVAISSSKIASLTGRTAGWRRVFAGPSNGRYLPILPLIR
jgi:hypothetical protein